MRHDVVDVGLGRDWIPWPLMMPPASVTSGLTQPVACSASVARVLSCRAWRIAAPTAVRIEVMAEVMLSNSPRIAGSAES